MAYDPVKAHEYYINYRKKGLLKGRKKGKGKAAKTPKSSLVGLGTAGLNDAGKMQWAMLKKELNEKMNAELNGVTDAAQRKSIIQKYQSQALAALQKIKTDPGYAIPKKAKASGSSKSSKKSSSSSKSKEDKDDDDENISPSSSGNSKSGNSSKHSNLTLLGGTGKKYGQHNASVEKKGQLQKGKKVAESSKESQEEKTQRLTTQTTQALKTIIEKTDMSKATPDQLESIRHLTENIVAKLEANGASAESIHKIKDLQAQLLGTGV